MSGLYERIEELCAARGMNITEMCRESGVPRSALSDYKAGRKKSISLKNMEKMADFFGVTIDAITGRTSISKEKTPTQKGERELPHAAYREVLSEGGIRLLLDADARVPQEHLDDIVEFIKFKQRKNGR